jgi:transcriptional regulator with XRE-family HTH domain
VFDEYMTIMDISLGEVAGCLGLTEQAINDRRNGRWPNIALTELERMAEIFGFPVALFLRPPTAMIRWCLDHRPEYFSPAETDLPEFSTT